MNSRGGGMSGLWRYWPVRVLVSIPAALVPIFGGVVAGGPYRGEPAAVAVAVAGAFACAAGWRVAISSLDKAACRNRPASRSAGQQIGTLAALSIPFVLLGAGLVLPVVFPPVSGLFSVSENLAFALLAAFPPFLFMLHARPRGRWHWACLGLCLPAMYAASLAAPFAMYYGEQALFSDDPGAAAAIALVVFVFAALNAPFAILLIRSGACALKYELPETAGEARQEPPHDAPEAQA